MAKKTFASEKKPKQQKTQPPNTPKMFKCPFFTIKKPVELVENTVQFQLLQQCLPEPAQAGRKVSSRTKQGFFFFPSLHLLTQRARPSV